MTDVKEPYNISGTNYEQGDLIVPPVTRPVIYATRGIISSGHYLTSMAGMRILLNGGNAFDAVVASTFAAAIVEPIASYSLAAECVFMLYNEATDELLSLSGQGGAPGKATREYYRSLGLDEIPTGPGDKAHLAFTIPGVVHSLISLLIRYGTKSLSEVLSPSLQYAEKGIPNYEYMLERLKPTSTKEQFSIYPPGGNEIFFTKGNLPKPGSILIQSNLAKTLRKMVNAENSSTGNRSDRLRASMDVFYKGSVAKSISDCSRKVGGLLRSDDLAKYCSKFEDPLGVEFMGYSIYGQSTWTQGPILMQTLNILENFDLRLMGHNTPEYIHTVVEALKLSLADREAFYGDPDFSTIPIDGLLSKEYARERAKLIRTNQAFQKLPDAGDPWKYSVHEDVELEQNRTLMRNDPKIKSEEEPTGTTHIAVIDDDGNMACATPSGGAFSKSVFFPEIGCALSTRMEMFNLDERHPNGLETGKRPRTTLVNYIVAKNGKPVYTVGCPGGDHQAQANVQLILNTLLFGMDPQVSIESPRFATDSAINSFYPHSCYPGRLSIENGIPEQTIKRLESLGHTINKSAVCGMGATITHRNEENHILSAGADPRRASYAIGW